MQTRATKICVLTGACCTHVTNADNNEQINECAEVLNVSKTAVAVAIVKEHESHLRKHSTNV